MKRFKEIVVWIGCAALFFWAVPGLPAEEGDEFDLAPPPEINAPGSENDSPNREKGELFPAPDLETHDAAPGQAPEQKPAQDSILEPKKTPGENEEEKSGEELKNLPNELKGDGEVYVLIPEDVSELGSPEPSEKAGTSGASPELETDEETTLEIPSETKPEEEPEIHYASAGEMTELRGKIQNILRIYRAIGLSTAENSPNDMMFFIMTYGCEAEIFLGCREANTHINAIGALCWNVPMKESVAFTGSTEKLMPRLGYGIQRYSGQLLAALAIARVPVDYRFPAGWTNVKDAEEKTDQEKDEKAKESNIPKLPKGKKNFSIRDLVGFEQKNCLWGRDLSLTLIGLSYYLEPDDEWETNDGEKWTLERVVKNELDREMKLDDSSATNQLLGLLCAIRCRKMRLGEESITGEYKRAESFMERYRKFILRLQNEIGVWHPKYFEMKGVTPNQPTEMLEASGHILRWLVTVTPKSELKDQRIFKSVKTVTELLEYQLAYWDPGNASGKEVEGIMTALHALAIYEKRAW